MKESNPDVLGGDPDGGGAAEVPALVAWALKHDLPRPPGIADEAAEPEWVPSFPMPASDVPVPRPRPRWWALAIAAVLAALVTVAALAFLGYLDFDEHEGAVSFGPEVVGMREFVAVGDRNTSAAAIGRKAAPSIVTVDVGPSGDSGVNRGATGPGVILTSDGFIVTNHHVVENAGDVRIVMHDGTTIAAERVGSDPITDLAVVRTKASNLPAITLGQTASLAIGDISLTVGHPLGMETGAPLTASVVLAFEREVATESDRVFGMLRTDALVTRGALSGALVDGSGRLVGLTTAIGASPGAEGVVFAIPVELVRRISHELITTGEVRHAFLGVRLDTHMEDRGAGATAPAGALITGFLGASTAEDAGLRAGDVITEFAGARIDTAEDLISRVRRFRVGDTVTVLAVRTGDALAFDVILGERPDSV